MKQACWSTLSMSSPDPRSLVVCSPWQGLSYPPVMRTRTPSLSMPSAGSSTSSEVCNYFKYTIWQLLWSVCCWFSHPFYSSDCRPCPTITLPSPPFKFQTYCHQHSSGSYSIDLDVFHYLLPVKQTPTGIGAEKDPLKVPVTRFAVFIIFLSATDAKERQHWVSRLQICTQHHTEAMGKVRQWVHSACIWAHIEKGKCLQELLLHCSWSFLQLSID